MEFPLKNYSYLPCGEFEEYQKHLGAGRIRTATLILYLRCLKSFPEVDPEILYEECWRRTVQISEKTESPAAQST